MFLLFILIFFCLSPDAGPISSSNWINLYNVSDDLNLLTGTVPHSSYRSMAHGFVMTLKLFLYFSLFRVAYVPLLFSAIPRELTVAVLPLDVYSCSLMLQARPNSGSTLCYYLATLQRRWYSAVDRSSIELHYITARHTESSRQAVFLLLFQPTTATLRYSCLQQLDIFALPLFRSQPSIDDHSASGRSTSC